jgi:hypothetical protein
MIDTTALASLFEDNRIQYLTELGIPESTYYRILKNKSASLETIAKICGYFDFPVQNLITIPEEYYQ